MERQIPFRRNADLEKILYEINSALENVEKETIQGWKKPLFPVVLILGPIRSGTTLFLQWLASLGIIAYPTNLLARFYGAPCIGAKIQLMLTDDRYNFRNELGEFRAPFNFNSENGKTTGVLAPNEFWYFWRRFIKYGELDFLSDDELEKTVDKKLLLSELAALTYVFNKPFALKGMILQQNIPFLQRLIEKALFIQIKRDPLFNTQSVLRARERQYGDIKEWYSFRIKEYEQLKTHDPIMQAAGQVYYINKAIDEGLHEVEEHKKIIVQYEDFCQQPFYYYSKLVSKLNQQGCNIDKPYASERQFANRNKINDEYEFEAIRVAYKRFHKDMI